MKPSFIDAFTAAAMKANGLDYSWFLEKYKAWIALKKGERPSD